MATSSVHCFNKLSAQVKHFQLLVGTIIIWVKKGRYVNQFPFSLSQSNYRIYIPIWDWISAKSDCCLWMNKTNPSCINVFFFFSTTITFWFIVIAFKTNTEHNFGVFHFTFTCPKCMSVSKWVRLCGVWLVNTACKVTHPSPAQQDAKVATLWTQLPKFGGNCASETSGNCRGKDVPERAWAMRWLWWCLVLTDMQWITQPLPKGLWTYFESCFKYREKVGPISMDILQ